MWRGTAQKLTSVFDGDTQEWFNNLTAVHSFKWEQAVLDHRLGRKARQDPELPGLHHEDPADMRLHGLPSEVGDLEVRLTLVR